MSDRIRFALKIALSLALVAWLMTRVDLAQVGAVMADVDPVGLGLATLAIVALVGPLSAWRWMSVIQAQGGAMPLRRALSLVMTGWFVNQFVPTGLGGDALRAWGARQDGASWEAAIHGVLLDRLLALAAMVVIVVVGWPVLSPLLLAPGARVGVALLLAGCAAALALVALSDRLRLERLHATLARVTGVAPACRALLLSPRTPRAVLAAVLTHFSLGFVVWLIARALGMNLPLLQVLMLMPLVLLIAMVPVSIAGWGVREGVMIVAFGLLGVPAARAFALSVLFGLSLLVAALPGGLLWLRGARPAAG